MFGDLLHVVLTAMGKMRMAPSRRSLPIAAPAQNGSGSACFSGALSLLDCSRSTAEPNRPTWGLVPGAAAAQTVKQTFNVQTGRKPRELASVERLNEATEFLLGFARSSDLPWH